MKQIGGLFYVGCPIRREIVEFKVRVSCSRRGCDLERTFKRLAWQIYRLSFASELMRADTFADQVAREVVEAGLTSRVKVRVQDARGEVTESEHYEGREVAGLNNDGAQLALVHPHSPDRRP